MVPELILGGLNFGANLAGQASAVNASNEQIDYMKWAQGQTWMREDNAIQRRVADLRAAGLSPILAAGSAAQSSAPITVGQRQTIDPSAATSAALQPILAASQLRQTEASIDATRAQTDAVRYDTASKNWHDKLTALFFPLDYEGRNANVGKTYADTHVSSAEAGLRFGALDRSRDSGQRPGSVMDDVGSVYRKMRKDVGAPGGFFDGLRDYSGGLTGKSRKGGKDEK